MDGEIAPADLRARLDGDAPRVVDIRTPASFREAHIPGSENLPLGQLPDRVDAVADADHVVTVCPHGKASVKAARLIAAYEGFDGRVESLRGGLEAWDGPLAGRAADAEDDGNHAEGDEESHGRGDEGPEAPF
ncbi:MAG: rhodanese-like domain-containing protein [Haloarculaceae archaeon]